MLVSSSQLLQGRFRSPLLGKEILTGSALAAFGEFLFQVVHANTWVGWSGASLNLAPALFLSGSQQSLYAVMWRICNLPRTVAQYAVLYIVLVWLVRRKSVATAVFFLCMLVVSSTHGSLLSALPISVVIGASASWIFARTGLVAAAAYLFTLNTLDRNIWPHNSTGWMLGPMIFSLALISALVAVGFFLATRKSRVFSNEVHRHSQLATSTSD